MGRARWMVPVAALLAIALVVQRVRAPSDAAGQPLASTECPFVGTPRVVVLPTVAPEDSAPVRAHEDVHASQCRALGPWRYRARNLTAAGRLSLEAPAYCAGARARIRRGMDSARVRERVLDDAAAAFAGRLDSATVRAALTMACPELVR